MPKVEALKPPDAISRRQQDNVLAWFHEVLADCAYALGDYATAERLITRAMEARQRMASKDPGDKREEMAAQALGAAVMARANQADKARGFAARSLEFERALSARNVDDPSQRFELAMALYGAAVAGAGDPAPMLTEASGIVDKLPPEMRSLHTVAAWRQRIAEEQKKRR